MINQSRIMNPQALISVFGNIPRLNNSELVEVKLRRDGATLFIRLLVKEIAETKPKRWSAYDVIYVDFSFFVIKDLSINGFGTYNQIDKLDIIDDGKKGTLDIVCSNNIYIKCSFDWAKIEQIIPGLTGSP